MPRATYLAPGVYVEEIPSAQQPIAGVGTNTVGFIGVVPDQILYPEDAPDFDPVVAQAALPRGQKGKANPDATQQAKVKKKSEIEKWQAEIKNPEEEDT